MKPTAEIADFILHRIGNIYFRPLMYGGTADGVEVLLDSYHELWAEIFEKQNEYKEVSYKIHSRQKCGAMNFTLRFRKLHPNAEPEAICSYVVKHWRKISKELGLPIPYEELRNFFKENEKIRLLAVSRG